MKITMDKKGFLEFLLFFVEALHLHEIKKDIGWIFGFYTLTRNIFCEQVYEKSSTNILKLIFSPFKMIFFLFQIIVFTIIFVIGFPLSLLWNIKIIY